MIRKTMVLFLLAILASWPAVDGAEKLGVVIKKKSSPEYRRLPKSWEDFQECLTGPGGCPSAAQVYLKDDVRNQLHDVVAFRLHDIAPYFGLGPCIEVTLDDKANREIGMSIKGPGAMRILVSEKGATITASSPWGEEATASGNGSFIVTCEDPATRCRKPTRCDQPPEDPKELTLVAETTAKKGCLFVGVHGSTKVKFEGQEVVLDSQMFTGIQHGEDLKAQRMDDECFLALKDKTTMEMASSQGRDDGAFDDFPPSDQKEVPDQSPILTQPTPPLPSRICPLCPPQNPQQ